MRFSEFKQYRPKAEHNVFVFVCEDDFLIDESRAVWRQAFGGDWTFEKIPAKEFEEVPVSQLMDDALTPSLFSKNRAIVVTHGEKLTKSGLETLAEIHKVPQSSLKVIVAISSSKGAQSLGKAFPVVDIDSVKPADAARWLIDRYSFPPDTARYIVQLVGTDLRLLSNEAQKLTAYVGDERPAQVRDVDVLVLRSEQFGAYDLDDAVIGRQHRKAAEVLRAMLDDGMEPLLVLSRIVRVWRQLFAGKALGTKVGPREMAQAAGLASFKANEFAAGCKKYGWPHLARGFQELALADKALKSSTDPKVYMDVLLWKLMA